MVFLFTVDTLWSGLFKIWRFSLQRIYSGLNLLKQGYSSRKLQTTFSKIIWSYRPCRQIWHFCISYAEWFVHQLWHMTRFRLLLNRDWYHMWGRRKCSLFKEHLISLSVGVHYFTHALYIHYIMCQSKDYVYGLMTLVWLHGLVWLLWDLFY